jgi:histone chaperone ASF1
VTYVGSATSPKYDQELDSVLVGPVKVGTSRFVLETDGPDPGKIPEDDLLGATVLMISCSYKTKEFIRIGYWVSNSYTEPLAEGE